MSKEKKDLEKKYGNKLMNTNGLYHLFDDKHNEIYINSETGKIDKRALYKTLVVLDDTVISEVIDDKNDTKFVVLDKKTLRCLYRTKSNINYLNESIVYDDLREKNGSINIISHTGKHLTKLKNIQNIYNIHSNYYIAKSEKMFNDKVLWYNKHSDKMEDLTEDKKYTINRESDKEIIILSMHGGKYSYSFETHKAFNVFTGKIEEDTQLFKIR